ncbi:MAG: nucleoid occlusion factor SlmA [Gammaproteobacteria bacterium]
MARARPGERREIILQTLARMLEEHHGERITTAELARAVGVSEAALYRHFSGKARMFEALLEFIEESLFSRINRILAEEPDLTRRVHDILFLVLGFAEKNPGMARILYGDILTGETERLRKRVAQIYDRLETQLKQILREAELAGGPPLPATETAAVLAAFVGGRIAHFVRSEFAVSPVLGWERQWALLSRVLEARR